MNVTELLAGQTANESAEINALAYRKVYSAYSYILSAHPITQNWHDCLDLFAEARNILTDNVASAAMFQVWEDIEGKYPYPR
jgi:hypothetical protein